MDGQCKKTARFKIVETQGGNAYRFFCELSGAAVCTVSPLRADNPEKEVSEAWETEGKIHFNKCHSCGKWVCDVMYNPDTFCCVDCTPWEDPPNYCTRCGSKVTENGESFCTDCGSRLMYGGVEHDIRV